MLKSDSTTSTSVESPSGRDVLVPKHCTLSGFTEVTSQKDGVHIGHLPPLTRLSFQTRNSRYEMTVVEPREWKVLVRGGRFFPMERFAYLCGSGYGGTLIKVAWIGLGLCCELSADGQRIVTSPVQEFEVLESDLPGPF